MNKFKLVSKYSPSGDQPDAIKKILNYLKQENTKCTLVGATGTGKTFTVAKVIEKINKPVLVLSHNKTLAFQLYNELKSFFPHNSVEYFVSYYNYYQPEAYIPATDTYIEKDSSINDMIDRLRLKATTSLMTRRDVIIVASVSAIYGLGSPELYRKSMIFLEINTTINIKEIISKLVKMQYERKQFGYERGTFLIKGDIIEIFPAYDEIGIRIELWDNDIDNIYSFNPVDGKIIEKMSSVPIFPSRHFMADKDTIKKVIKDIKNELKIRLSQLQLENKLIEAQRLESRTKYDLEMIEEIGYCNGIENYSRFFDGRKIGEPSSTLIDFFPKDFLTVIDESHVSLPQIKGMYAGDRSRKTTLVDFGFRLPAALDNRPLKFEEFYEKIGSTIFVSATPGDFETRITKKMFIEQINRPTGIPDPIIEVRKTNGQIDNLINEIEKTIKRKEKVIVITITKKMAEDLSKYFSDLSIKSEYLHSELKQEERNEKIEALKNSEYDVIIGVNLLREGIDLPIVSLVAIMDADKEGFLRNYRSLIQIIGRASRNINGKVILYADKTTDSMKKAIDETQRRRNIQLDFNKKNNIIPKNTQIKKYQSIQETTNKTLIASGIKKDYIVENNYSRKNKKTLEKELKIAIKKLDFEKAIIIRDKLKLMENS